MDFEGLPGRDPPFSSWEKVTRKTVDPITFSCRFNITYVPRIEDCSYETTTVALGEPRFEAARRRDSGRLSWCGTSPRSSFGNHPNGSNDDDAWRPHDFSNHDTNSTASTSSSSNTRTKSNTQSHLKPSKNHVKPTKSGGEGDKGASLGAFFSKDAVQKVLDLDNQSVGSRSMNSRSVSERSNAERSKAEDKIKLRRVQRPDGGTDTQDKTSMMSIDEQNAAEFGARKTKGGMLEQFLNETSIPTSAFIEVDAQSHMSASTIGTRSVSLLSTTDRSKQEKMLKSKTKNSMETPDPQANESKPAKPILKKTGQSARSVTAAANRKIDFKEGHDICEVPKLNDKEYYRDWDDIWYSEDEIGDMRYAAFLEEAGLDVDEYMNMK